MANNIRARYGALLKMSLPSPSEIDRSEYYDDYFIRTPTFDLTPIEKPDMSPFLIHMTGRDKIVSILQGDEEVCEAEEGVLLAAVPDYRNGQLRFQARVVCFTESPTFAIDFFRYRRVERWAADQIFGIGFSKSALSVRGVRPVIYLEDELVKSISSFHFQALRQLETLRTEAEQTELSENEQEKLRELEKFSSTLSAIYPLLFPLRERNKYQGFMWEREWRFFGSDTFTFNYQDIEIICCPEEEETPIREILGAYAEDIVFVRTWDQYSDVTQYLVTQQAIWEQKNARIAQTNRRSARRTQLQRLMLEKTKALRSIQSYVQFIEKIQRDLGVAQGSEEILQQEIQELQGQLEELEQEE